MFRFIYVILINVSRMPYIIIKARRMIRNKDKYSLQDRYTYAQEVIQILLRTGKIETLVYGLENLPQEGGYMMFPNHQGKYDALGIMYAHERPCSFVMDKAKSYQFLVREICDLTDAKRISLNDVRQAFKIINELKIEVAEGKRYILFSEGGYHHNKNHVQEFKPGSFKSAVLAQAPIVPVALIDSYLPFNSFKLGKVTTKVIFIKPLYYDDYKDMKTPEIANEVRNRIINAMKEFGIEDAGDTE